MSTKPVHVVKHVREPQGFFADLVVPSKFSPASGGKAIPRKRRERELHDVESDFARKFGGFTETATEGGFMSATGQLQKEKGTLVESFVQPHSYRERREDISFLQSEAGRVKKDLSQESVMFSVRPGSSRFV